MDMEGLFCLSFDILYIWGPVCYTTLHLFNSLISRTMWVIRHQKGRIILDLKEARDDGVAVDYTQIICSSLQTYNRASTSRVRFYRPHALPAAQPTASKHWRLSTEGLYDVHRCMAYDSFIHHRRDVAALTLAFWHQWEGSIAWYHLLPHTHW